MGDRSSSSKHRICSIEDEPRPKRIRKQVERYGVGPQNIITPRKVVETRTLRRQTTKRTRRSARLMSVSPRKPIKVEIEDEVEEETKDEIKVEEKSPLELCDLSEEVLLLILERIPACGLINLSRTSKQFNRLCVLDTIWKQRCRVDFDLQTRWPEFTYLYLYEMFYKADVLRFDQNFFKPVSQLKTSVIVWYLMNPEPPCHVVSHLTASQVKSIWGITEEELEEMYFDESDDRPEMFPLCHYEWTKLYSVFVRKHGGRTAMQNYVLKRCLRNRQALEEHYRLSQHTSRRQKWYQYLEDRDVGNREALRALTEHMPKVTYVYMLHKITAMYIDGQLKGGFQTVKDYAEFCGRFKSWLEEKSLKLWPPRHGDVLAQDYRDALDYVNKELSLIAGEQELTVNDFLNKACSFIERLHEVWLWQNHHGTSYRKEHRSSILVRRHDCFRKYLEKGHVEDWIQLRLYFERREVLSHWLKDNLWLVSLIGDSAIQSLRPPLCSTEVPVPLLNGDPVSCLVQRFLETGLQSDFNKIRMKLVDISNLQIRILAEKARKLQEAICADSLRPDRHFYLEPPQHRKMIMPSGPLYRNSTPYYHCGAHIPKFPVDPRLLRGHPS